MQTNLEAIEYKSLSLITRDKIRREIIEGKLPAGTRITETEMSEKLAVSRVVIREAFIELTQEGLLVKERNKYTQVVEFSKKDIKDVFDLRIALEVAAAINCIESKKEIVTELTEKSNIIDRLMQDKENTDISDLIKSDLNFHFHIISRSENERIINIWRGLSGQILVLLYKFIINKGLGSNLDYEHSEIIEAFKRNDSSDIQKVLTRHINDIKYFLQDNYC